jgi:hypothetical protein
MLMTGLFWREVLSGRYNPEFWDVDGDDEKLRDRDPIPQMRNDTAPQVKRGKRKSVYDLIDGDGDGGGSER